MGWYGGAEWHGMNPANANGTSREIAVPNGGVATRVFVRLDVEPSVITMRKGPATWVYGAQGGAMRLSQAAVPEPGDPVRYSLMKPSNGPDRVATPFTVTATAPVAIGMCQLAALMA